MEASKFGFGRDLSPAFKFDPTDADIVAYYLLPRALGLPNPYAHAIIDDDPWSATPWELLDKYGGGKIDHAFFFGPPRGRTKNGGRQSRTIKGGGVWKGQGGYEGAVTLLRPGGGEVDITFKRYTLTFHCTKRGPSTGYVMHEYEIISPPLPGTMLTRVRINPNKKAKMEKAAAGANQKVVFPEYDAAVMACDADQKVVFSEYDAAVMACNADQKAVFPEFDAAVMACNGDQKVVFPEYAAAVMACNGEGFGTAQQTGALYGGGNGGDMAETGGYYYSPLSCVLPEMGYDDYGLPVTDQLGASHNAAAMKTENQGFAGAQADAFYGGGMAETGGANFDPSQFMPVGGGEGINYYGQYQQGYAPWPYQPDQHHNHNPYYAEDAAVMCSGDEGFGIEQQASALPGYVGDAAVIFSGDDGYSVERQACALPGYLGDATVIEGFSGEGQASVPCGYAGDAAVIFSIGEGFSIEQKAGALPRYVGDAAVMCSGGAGFSVEQKAGALCGHSDNGEEENWDALYDALYRDNDGGFSCELSGAGEAATDGERVN